MRTWPTRRRLTWVTLAAATALTLSACGSSNGSDASSSPVVHAVLSKDRAAAIATTSKYTTAPSAFPVSDPLPKALPAGMTFGWLQCSSSVCAQLTTLFTAATHALSGKLIVVKAGPSAQEAQTALSSLIEQKPAAIFLPSVEPETLGVQIAKAKSAGIPLISTGIMDPTAHGLSGGAFGKGTSVLAGQLLADWIAAHEKKDAKVVFYTTPELDFLSLVTSGFNSEMSAVCPKCSVRTVKVPIASYGTTAPSLMVSDLQAHPDTDIAVVGAAAAASGLPAALKVARIATPYIGFSLTPGNLQDIQNGAQKAGLGLDYPIIAWTMVDEAVRLILKAPLSAAEKDNAAVVQWLDSSNLHGDVSAGWIGYPDYAAKFTSLWTVK